MEPPRTEHRDRHPLGMRQLRLPVQMRRNGSRPRKRRREMCRLVETPPLPMPWLHCKPGWARASSLALGHRLPMSPRNLVRLLAVVPQTRLRVDGQGGRAMPRQLEHRWRRAPAARHLTPVAAMVQKWPSILLPLKASSDLDRRATRRKRKRSEMPGGGDGCSPKLLACEELVRRKY